MTTIATPTTTADAILVADAIGYAQNALRDGCVKNFIVKDLTAIGAQLTKAREDRSAVLDTLLEEVQRGLALERENADLRGQVVDLRDKVEGLGFQLGEAESLVEAKNEAIGVLSTIDPGLLRKAAFTIRHEIEVAQKEMASDPIFGLAVELMYPTATAKMAEGAQQLDQYADQIERLDARQLEAVAAR
jgi:uncharacterized protein (UPF0335 family)